MDTAASRPFAPTLPDYAGASIANLMGSIARAFEVPHAACPPLREAHAQVLAGHRHVVLLLVDGLGLRLLHRHRPDSALAAHIRATLTSVFPSTTASAISGARRS